MTVAFHTKRHRAPSHKRNLRLVRQIEFPTIMRILIVGNGAREHAIARRLVHEGCSVISYRTLPNFALDELCDSSVIATEFQPRDITRAAIKSDADCIFPCAEESIFRGISDTAQAAGVHCFCPSKYCAQLEYDKEWARRIVGRDFSYLLAESSTISHVTELAAKFPSGFVLRRVGAPQNLSIFRFSSTDDAALSVAGKILQRYGSMQAQAYMNGRNFSLYAFIHGSNLHWGPVVRDYPFLYEMDRGPKTGGMGCILKADGLRDIRDSDIDLCKDTVQSLLHHLSSCGHEYEGILVAQFMVFDDRVFFTEIDVRPGDTEFINVLDTMVSKLSAVVDRDNSDGLAFDETSSVSVAFVPHGYPTVNTTAVFDIPDTLLASGSVFFGASIREGSGFRAVQGRACTIVSKHLNYGSAVLKANALAESISSAGLYHRQDIGAEELGFGL